MRGRNAGGWESLQEAGSLCTSDKQQQQRSQRHQHLHPATIPTSSAPSKMLYTPTRVDASARHTQHAAPQHFDQRRHLAP